MDEELKKLVESIKSSIENKADKQALESLIDTSKKYAELEAVVLKQAETIEAMKTAPKPETLNAFAEATKTMVANFEAKKEDKVCIKEVGDMLTSTNITGNNTQPVNLRGIVDVRTPDPKMFGLCNVWNQPEGFVIDVAYGSEEGDAAETAESQAKNQADGVVAGVNYTMQNINVYYKISRKMLQNLPYIQNMIQGKLLKKVIEKASKLIIQGVGNGTTGIKGIGAFATAWAAGDYTNVFTAPNLYHALLIGVAQTRALGFNPNAILVRSADAVGLRLAAWDGNKYLPEMYVQNGTLYVAGVQVIESNEITGDKFFIGEFALSNVAIQSGFTVYIDPYTGLTTNMVTLLGEMDLLHYISANEVGGFITGDVSSAITALTKPTS